MPELGVSRMKFQRDGFHPLRQAQHALFRSQQRHADFLLFFGRQDLVDVSVVQFHEGQYRLYFHSSKMANKAVEATAIKPLVEVGVLRAVPHLDVRQRNEEDARRRMPPVWREDRDSFIEDLQPTTGKPMPVVQRRLVLLDADESLRAIKWARDHAEELEKFHRREGEYYAELPRSADDHANAKSYARIKRALTAILEQNVSVEAPPSEGAASSTEGGSK